MKSVMNLPKTPKYEVFNHKDVKDFACFRILSDEYVGLTFHFTKITVGEDTGEEVPLSFNYNIVDDVHGNEYTKEQLDSIICSILFDVVEKNAQEVSTKA